MMIGLKRGTVLMCNHCAEWEIEAQKIIVQLQKIFAEYAVDIQHIGSTSIKNIKAKPIIDIVIGVNTFDGLDKYIKTLLDIGVYQSSGQPFDDIVLFSKDDNNGDRLNNIQVVIYGEEQWNKHILFRDYMNSHTDKSAEYERIKTEAAELFPNDVLSYSNYKSAFIIECIEEAKRESDLIIKTLNIDELYQLSQLFSYNNLEEMIENNSRRIKAGEIDIFGLFSNKELIGELRVMYSNLDERFAKKGKRAYLYAFRIHKDYQGKGLGKYLLKHVIDKLTQNGYYEITVGVEDDNERAKHIYNSFGFDKIISRIQEDYQGENYEYNLYLKSK